LSSFSVLGTPLEVQTYSGLVDEFDRLLARPGTWAVDFTNTQIVTMRRHDSEFFDMTTEMDLFVPDGMPLVWCLNRQGADLEDRVYGPTFMRHCVLSGAGSRTHYFLGGSDECIRLLTESFVNQDPRIRIVGTHNGYFDAEQEPTIVEEINRLSPDFIWVGLGTPKQQEWIFRNKAKIRRGIILAVGFAFDVNAGTKKDAPLWMQRHGLGWLFRLINEPRRLGPRYLRYNSLFLFYLLLDGIGRHLGDRETTRL
jgi:N-acetylglucosaminyldiphosphoundecaprenol N-acetyl-beta-D-mannosaminyltransferase